MSSSKYAEIGDGPDTIDNTSVDVAIQSKVYLLLTAHFSIITGVSYLLLLAPYVMFALLIDNLGIFYFFIFGAIVCIGLMFCLGKQFPHNLIIFGVFSLFIGLIFGSICVLAEARSPLVVLLVLVACCCVLSVGSLFTAEQLLATLVVAFITLISSLGVVYVLNIFSMVGIITSLVILSILLAWMVCRVHLAIETSSDNDVMFSSISIYLDIIIIALCCLQCCDR
ncbi:hypothetical protein GEMRC1_008000 [Eukaryota sp. GEM-RC1]